MKKRLFLLFISSLFVLFQGHCADDEEIEKKGVIVENKDDLLEKITDKVPGVKEAIAACRDEGKSGDQLDKCVWEEKGLDQEAILSALENYSGDIRKPAQGDENGSEYEYKQDGYKIQQSKSIKKLEAYLKTRLEEALHGKDQPADKLKVAQDHTDFYRVWQSQLGKNLIVQLSNYCMYSHPVTGLVPHKDATKLPENSKKEQPSNLKAAFYYRKQNLASLGTIVDRPKNRGQASQSYIGFEQCISKVGLDCRGTAESAVDKRYPMDAANKETILNDMLKVTSDEEALIKNSIPHPCEINRYMTGVKRALEESKFLVDEMGKNREAGFAVANIEQRKSLNTDEVVNISSGDLLKNDDYKEAVQEEVEKLDECAQNGMNPDCEEYLSDAEANEGIEDEAFIRGLALKKKLEANLTGTDVDANIDDLKKYFTDKGMTDENFDKMLAQEMEKEKKKPNPRTQEEVLKELISTYYDNERKAIQSSLQERLKETAKADPTTGGASADQNTVATIKKKLENSPEELAVLYHYSNVVSAFIDVTGADGSSGKNTAALAAELKNNHFDQGNASGRGTASSPGSVPPSNLEALQEFAGSGSSSSGESTGATLDAGQVDQLQFGLGSED